MKCKDKKNHFLFLLKNKEFFKIIYDKVPILLNMN